jgi:hypothetical protein
MLPIMQQQCTLTRKPSQLFHARIRGTHRGTFLQYSSYSAPNVLRNVGSSYSSTNKNVTISAADATPIATRFARPKTTQSPPHPTKNPKYIGFRTYRYSPTTTSLLGGAIGAGVPCPVHPKSHTHRSATAKPITEGTPAIQRHRAALEVSTRKPSQDDSNQNHSAKNAAPTASDVIVIGQRAARSLARMVPTCRLAMETALLSQSISAHLIACKKIPNKGNSVALSHRL